jgi:hypothetical protein
MPGALYVALPGHIVDGLTSKLHSLISGNYALPVEGHIWRGKDF